MEAGILETGRRDGGAFLCRRGEVAVDNRGGLGVNGGVKQLYRSVGLLAVFFKELAVLAVLWNGVLSTLMSYVYKHNTANIETVT